MQEQNMIISTKKKRAISLPNYLLLISVFITVGGGFANQSLLHINESFSTSDLVIIPLFALVFYAMGIITQDK